MSREPSENATQRDIERRNLRQIGREHGDRWRASWLTYGPCPRCRALPGNPCRETGWGLMSKPHHGRPLAQPGSG